MKIIYKLILSLGLVPVCLFFPTLAACPGLDKAYFHVPNGHSSLCIEVIPIYNDEVEFGLDFKASVRCLAFDVGEPDKRVLWNTVIPYPNTVYLSGCGKFMVAERPICRSVDQDEFKNWPLLEFYIEGKSIARKTFSELGVDHTRYISPINGNDHDVVSDVRIVDTTDDQYPTDEELNLFKNQKDFEEDVFKSRDELLYVLVDSREYYFYLSNGELAFKKITDKINK